jgi:N-acetyl-gamma-glutamyl-phosphate reductase
VKRVFIDGSAGTTGLRIRERLASRNDLSLVILPEELRKDPQARRQALNEADVAFLCLPDAAAVEAAAMVENPRTVVIDTSTAHRTADGWEYGFPELFGRRVRLAHATRIANPGCHASGFIALVEPLVRAGLLPRDAQLSAFSLTGYSGGGKKMIAQYESPDREPELDTPRIYGLNLRHKHLPEMQKIAGLAYPPVFNPVVDDYYKGMATTLMLHNRLLNGAPSAESIAASLAGFYRGQKLVSVLPFGTQPAMLGANTLAGKDTLVITVCGHEEQTMITAQFDNLGKGASGAAVQNMNLMLGFDETAGLAL